MTTIAVKPNPDLPLSTAKLIVHPISGGLLDAAGVVPDVGRQWLYDGVTCRFLTDGVIMRADDPIFAPGPAPADVPTDPAVPVTATSVAAAQNEAASAAPAASAAAAGTATSSTDASRSTKAGVTASR